VELFSLPTDFVAILTRTILGETTVKATTVSVTYGLRSRVTGALARLISDVVDADGTPVPPRYRLAVPHDDAAQLVYETPTAAQAAFVKAFDTPWETSSLSYPAWGVLDMSEYEVAVVTKETSYGIADYKVPEPVTFDRVIGQRETTYEKATLYLKDRIPFEFIRKPLSFGVAPIPAGESFESLQEKCKGRFILVREDAPQLCVGVTELPAEYRELFTFEEGVGLILTRVPD
jgi:hypothetical protein